MKSCLCCGAWLFPSEGGCVCQECMGTIRPAAALALLACSSREPRFKYHYESPLPEPLLPTPWCHEVLNPTPGAHCLVCLDQPGDREQIGRGSGEPCLRKAVATWGQPTAKETR